MFRRSRKRIVASVMLSLVLFLVITIGVIYTSSYLRIRNQNIEMLRRYVGLYSLDEQPGEGSPPEFDGEPPSDIPPDAETPEYKLSTFYSVAVSESSEVLATDSGKQGVYTESELVDTAQEILEKGRTSGRLGSLLYMTEKRDGFTLVAFMDITVSMSSMNTLINYTIAAGLVALVVLFIVSMRIADRIITPLEQNDMRQKQFVSDAGHELKTPISVISANAELLHRQSGESEWLSNICYETDRMSSLVRQLLDLSRAENAELVTEEINLSRLVTGEVLPFESVAFEQGLTIESNIADDVLVNGNRSQLGQLVSILLDNATRHSSGGNAVDVSLQAEHKQAVLAVSNSSEPIPKEKQARLFERFYRVDEVRNSEDGHYGLGLAIAKAITERHGGTIGVKCEDGRVIFKVTIPLRKI
ncbi:MAG: GHKL domain-containing protein [Ruminococcus sp.]|nr:GHKL domain-containing protein [Ruminococcus sp.]